MWEVGGAVLKIFPIGQWMMPCWITDNTCRARYEENRSQPEDADLNVIAGYHWFASIWG